MHVRLNVDAAAVRISSFRFNCKCIHLYVSELILNVRIVYASFDYYSKRRIIRYMFNML